MLLLRGRPKASVERPWRRRMRGAARLRRRVEPWATVCSSASPWCRTGAAARAGLPTSKGRLAKSLHHPRTALRYALREVCQFDEGGRIRQLLADPSDTSRAHPRPNSLHVLTFAQRTRVYFCPQHWLLLYHLGYMSPSSSSRSSSPSLLPCCLSTQHGPFHYHGLGV